MRLALSCSLLTFMAVAFVATSQDFGEAESVYVPAQPLDRVAPDYPARAAARGTEGWVMLSFVISATGDVLEPMIEESSGGEPFERAALRAVERWKYVPATEDGKPVEQAMVNSIIRFELEGRGGRASRAERASKDFVENYQELVRLVNGQDFQAAGALLAEMEADEGFNRYETAWFWWAKYVYLSRASSTDVAEMRRALERAIGFEDVYLLPDHFVSAAERLVVLHAQAFDIASAIATFERLRDAAEARVSRNHEQSVANLKPSYEAMLELVNGEQSLVMNGAVGEFDYWVHDLLRRSFAVAEIKGRLDALDIRCERGTRRYDSVPSDTVWRVPEAWGTCGVYLKGEPGTTFAFREYPRSYASPAAVDVGARRR
jgi:TonB family protein